MLVVTRKPEQTVKITVPPSTEPIEITIKVNEIFGQNMKMGITAPHDVKILRGEVVDRDAEQRKQNQPHGK